MKSEVYYYTVKELYKFTEHLKSYYSCDKILLEPFRSYEREFLGFTVHKFKPAGQSTLYTHDDIKSIMTRSEKTN